MCAFIRACIGVRSNRCTQQLCRLTEGMADRHGVQDTCTGARGPCDRGAAGSGCRETFQRVPGVGNLTDSCIVLQQYRTGVSGQGSVSTAVPVAT